ncbi:hypothetical protein [Paraburkholderia unamae]|uniref:Uncharacterized protein n=1 Tax=Paraburkholderia unamae TaxID=219649 RepID=A0ACC6RXS1_9BURK
MYQLKETDGHDKAICSWSYGHLTRPPLTTPTTRHLHFRCHTQIDETLAFIEESAQGWLNGTLIRCVLEDRASGRLTGMIALRPHPPRVEIGVIDLYGQSRQDAAGQRKADRGS